MDQNNKKLLQLLKQNSRYSFEELSDLLGISAAEVESKIQQMTDEGLFGNLLQLLMIMSYLDFYQSVG